MIYLASPYMHEDSIVEEQRFKFACLAAARLISDGFPIYCPVAMSHPIHVISKGHRCPRINRLHYKPPEFWYKFDLNMLEHCEKLIILGIDGWKDSKGIFEEYKYFLKQELPWTMIGWMQVTDYKPLFLKWYRGDEIEKVAEEIGV